MKNRISSFIERAKQGESVYINEVRDAFATYGATIECTIETPVGETYNRSIPIEYPNGTQEKSFVRDYFYANIYNIISTYGGKQMTIGISRDDDFVKELCDSLDEVFQTGIKRTDRTGYGMILNVADRVNATMGYKPFSFVVTQNKHQSDTSSTKITGNTVEMFRKAIKSTNNKVLIGLDIGGTDIKAVSSVNGTISSFFEYDWNPAGMTKIEQMTEAIEKLVKKICFQLGSSASPDGIGVGFPDVVIKNRIVGGETMKTRGIRQASSDYEGEFSKLLNFNEMLLGYCRPGGVVRITNDGSLAAYTAAVELAGSERAGEITDGVFAHTLGTELGTGWINENGDIPQIPLEIYNCIIDMGNYPAREFKPFDLRSIRNFNTDIAGTMQKYASQSGAYRLALEYFKKDAPEQYDELFKRGYIEKRENGIFVVMSPEDKRKPLLAHIMALADAGLPQAENIFREIGKCLAATWCETEFLLDPKAKHRILYGRFVKSHRCLELMQEGACEVKKITLEAGDDDLAYTPLMQELRDDPNYTVAQFGQAVGAVYFAAQGLL